MNLKGRGLDVTQYHPLCRMLRRPIPGFISRTATSCTKHSQMTGINLSSCFLVACGAINLPSKKESLYALCLKGGIQLTRVYAVILNTIPYSRKGVYVHSTKPIQHGTIAGAFIHLKMQIWTSMRLFYLVHTKCLHSNVGTWVEHLCILKAGHGLDH